MPELPDIQIYLEALETRVLGQPIEKVELLNPFVLRTVDPPMASVIGKRVVGVGRLGKRILIRLDDEIVIIVHLMIAGRLRWRAPNAKLPPLPMRPWIGSLRARTLPFGNGPSSCAVVLSAVVPPGPGPNRIGVSASREPLTE